MEFYTAFFGLLICFILCPYINIIIKTLQKQFHMSPAGWGKFCTCEFIAPFTHMLPIFNYTECEYRAQLSHSSLTAMFPTISCLLINVPPFSFTEGEEIKSFRAAGEYLSLTYTTPAIHHENNSRASGQFKVRWSKSTTQLLWWTKNWAKKIYILVMSACIATNVGLRLCRI